MNYLLDTCVLSEMTKKRPNEKVVSWFCRQNPKSLYVSYLTVGELQRGIVKLGRTQRAKTLAAWMREKVLNHYGERILPVEETVAVEWGRISGTAECMGKSRPQVDSLIAATAVVHKMKLVTRNVRDMEGMGAEILNPFE